MKTQPSWVARAFFGLLVAFFPKRIRKRFAPEMRQLFLDSYAEAKASTNHRSMAAFYLRAFGDLIVNAIIARRDRPKKSTTSQGHSRSSLGNLESRRVGLVERALAVMNGFRICSRGIGKSPGFALVVVLTLGLGVGASTAIFSVVDGVLLSSLPYPEPSNLLVLQERGPLPEGRSSWVAEPTFRDWREQTEVFDDIVAWRLLLATITGNETPERLQGYVVSAGFFPLMGIEMTLGRGFHAEEDRPGAAKVAVISHRLWERRFASDPEILGRSIVLDGETHTIVGVAGEKLNYPEEGDIWTPIALEYIEAFRGFRYLGVLGRLRPGMTIADAQSDLDRVTAAIIREHPETNTGWGVIQRDLKSRILWGVLPVLSGMMVAASLLLLIATGNVTNLFIARMVDRQTEVAIRRAMGATRTALARLFVSEALVLSLLGGAAGIGIAHWGTKSLSVLAQGRLPRLEAVSIDGSVLAFALTLSLVVGAVVGILPALVAPRSSPGTALQGGTRSVVGRGKANRAREIVLTVQVAMAITMLVGASLLARSLWHLNQVNPGFDADNLYSLELNLPESRYDDDGLLAAVPEILQRVAGIPGVEEAGSIHPMPMVLGSVASRYAIESSNGTASGEAPTAHPRIVSAGYFEAMKIPLLSGRYLDNTDRMDNQSVVVVNQTFAERFLPEGSPLGVKITSQDPENPDAEWSTVVGVVGDVLFRTLTTESEPEVYVPVLQRPYGFGQLVMRTQSPPDQMTPQVAAILREVDPDIPVARVLTGNAVLERSLGPARLSFTLVSVFAVVAATLAVVGVVGVLTLLVGRRLREIGIRMVLGAPPESVLHFVLVKGLRPVTVGLFLGGGISVGLTRFLSSQVHGVSTLDPLSFLVPAIGFFAVSWLACHWPARRAGMVDPASVLRSE